MSDFNYLNIHKAYEIIKHAVNKTPLITNDYINHLLDAKVYFKLENLQKTGSFKLRGATNKISQLSKENKLRGLVAYSSGNHAQAVAYASLQENISAKIIMPIMLQKLKLRILKNIKQKLFYMILKKKYERKLAKRLKRKKIGFL